jgi:hypothetical protein
MWYFGIYTEFDKEYYKMLSLPSEVRNSTECLDCKQVDRRTKTDY